MPTNSVMFVATDGMLADETISSPTGTGVLKYLNDSVHRTTCKAPRGTRTSFPISPRILRIPSRVDTIYWRKLTLCSSQCRRTDPWHV